jgi:hypothetical protein
MYIEFIYIFYSNNLKLQHFPYNNHYKYVFGQRFNFLNKSTIK